MAELIDRQAALKKMCETCKYCEKFQNGMRETHPDFVTDKCNMYKFIAEQPTIEPKRGEWIDDRTDIICSNCKTGFNYEMLLFIREALESGTVDGMECRCPKCGSYNQYGGADNG